jgi:hypothetical protein
MSALSPKADVGHLNLLQARNATGLGRETKRIPRSEQLEDTVDRPVGMAVAYADCDDAVQPVIFRSAGFKQAAQAEIVARRIDRLAAI